MGRAGFRVISGAGAPWFCMRDAGGGEVERWGGRMDGVVCVWLCLGRGAGCVLASVCLFACGEGIPLCCRVLRRQMGVCVYLSFIEEIFMDSLDFQPVLASLCSRPRTFLDLYKFISHILLLF